MRRIIALTIAAAALAEPAGAQTLFGASARIAPQFVSYSFPKPIDRSISEFAFPIAVVVPVTDRMNVDLSTAFATSTVKIGSTESKISGLTDTQLRGNFTLGNDAVVITAGLNLPTGQSTVSRSEQDAAAAISDDFLVFPVPTFGTGLAATGGVAFARSMGAW